MKIDELKNVTVIGAGAMGHGIAQVALMSGYDVTLCDIKDEFVQRGKQRILESLDKLCRKGKVEQAVVDRIRSKTLHTSVTLSEAVKDADLVIEAVPEVMEIKLDTFRNIDKYAPERTIVASNTSTMSITAFAKATNRPDRIVGTHYFNPAVLMMLVEVVCSEYTSQETAKFACEYVRRVGKECILARKDTPGFIANRIAYPDVLYTRLCMDVDGLTADDIDATMMAAGQKMGPMELADYSGIDIQNNCMRYFHDNLSADYEIGEYAAKLEQEGNLGKKTGKGYYIWPEKGRPNIDDSKRTGSFDPHVWFFIQANEACKLVEDGVCGFEDCDKAMKYGYNAAGPIEYIQCFTPDKVAAVLDALAERYGKKVFSATKSIRNGLYIVK